MKSYHNSANSDMTNTNEEKKNDDNAENIIVNKKRVNDDIEDFMRNSRHTFSIDTEDKNASVENVTFTNSRVSKIIISIVLSFSLASSASVKRDRERSKKHVDHVNLAKSFDICFVMNN